MNRNAQTTERATKEKSGYFRLDEETYDRLTKAARASDLPVSTVVRAAIREYLKKLRVA